MNYESFPCDIVETELICALRFDGYAYEETSGLNIGNLPAPMVETGQFYEDSLKNFATFFILQRYLHKWGGDSLTKYTAEHIAYDLLYLHLYQLEAPADYAHKTYSEKWEAIEQEKKEAVAAHIRHSLCRKGVGRMDYHETPHSNLEH